MKFGTRCGLLTRTLVAAICALSFVMSSAAKAGTWIEEPIFGLYYYPSEAHFTMLPFKTLLPECSKLLNEYRPRPKTLTLYATYRSGTKSLYIAGANGVLGLYVIESGTCDIDVPILALLRKPHIPPLHAGPPMLSDTEVSGLFDDALRRYTTAFGGKQHFLQWLDTLTAKKRGGCESQPELSCPQTYKLLLAPQKTQLENYRLK